MTPYQVYIDIATSDLTLKGFMAEVIRLQQEHPKTSFFIDGDQYALVGVPREASA